MSRDLWKGLALGFFSPVPFVLGVATLCYYPIFQATGVDLIKLYEKAYRLGVVDPTLHVFQILLMLLGLTLMGTGLHLIWTIRVDYFPRRMLG